MLGGPDVESGFLGSERFQIGLTEQGCQRRPAVFDRFNFVSAAHIESVPAPRAARVPRGLLDARLIAV